MKFQIMQIMPAENWFAKYLVNNDEESIDIVPLVCWGLGILDGEKNPSIRGMIQVDGKVVPADQEPAFIGYDMAELSFVNENEDEEEHNLN